MGEDEEARVGVGERQLQQAAMLAAAVASSKSTGNAEAITLTQKAHVAGTHGGAVHSHRRKPNSPSGAFTALNLNP